MTTCYELSAYLVDVQGKLSVKDDIDKFSDIFGIRKPEIAMMQHTCENASS